MYSLVIQKYFAPVTKYEKSISLDSLIFFCLLQESIRPNSVLNFYEVDSLD